MLGIGEIGLNLNTRNEMTIFEEQVELALGELVSYLEFEIKNHPGIEDPDAILAGVAELRAATGL